MRRARAQAYGLAGAAFGLGFVAGPVLGGLLGAAAQSWISRSVRADEQGTVQGALTGIGAVAETVVPITAGLAFGWSLTYAWPGSVYLGAAVFAAGSALLLAATPDVAPRAVE
ncbi:hypothetical protein [Verrucosispora sp. WMMD1129]|uniref:hypothetical protein n=1 Tax=Verrucosispora sp. WMMD1129 TaxID=3016093 RepID=UPI00249BCCF6|nr:hypothetical protein [Verrucosispora sp. WMMD1129]WFE42986.1 hypothetical protein O7624_01005 [Verrucosispora sp. WMMD1129]